MAQVAIKPTNVTLVPGSPAVKRQKTTAGYQSTSTGYNSEADSGDDLFEGVVDTPLAKHFTQPTQIIDRSGNLSSPISEPSPVVQIPASSPFRQERTTVTKPPPPSIPKVGRLASLMAPAGTSFRSPAQRPVAKPLSQKKPIYIDLSDDDGPQYKGGSSDDDGISRAEIKPSSFGAKSSKSSFGGSVSSPGSTSIDKFKDLIATSMFKPGQKRTVFDLKGSVYDGRNRDPSSTSSKIVNPAALRKQQAQTRPERAMPVQDINEEDIADEYLRRKVTRLRKLNPGAFTVLMCQNALLKCKGNVDDAAALLMPAEVQEISDDEFNLPSISQLAQEPQMKHTLNAPIKSIAERYTTSTQLPKKPPQLAVVTPSKKTKKRLVQGRRHPSSPVQEPVESPKLLKKSVKPVVNQIDYDSDRDSFDSGLAAESEEDDPELEDRVLRYLNNCKAEELAEFVSVDIKDAELMVARRPFRNLDIARTVSSAATTKTGKRSAKAPIGDKIVDSAIRMQAGYEAVDVLVEEVKRLGKPLAEEISKWGFNVYGASKGEESVLEINSLDCGDDSTKDSGLGTPSSKATSQNGDVDDDVVVIASRAKRQTKFIDKPAIMDDGFVLKDFQRVGLNWLALLYRHELSCILADEMGCGKTCQIISFLAYLTESGIASGPHLVIVPPSTLENWLREFARFCPKLIVDPYYGSQAEREEAAYRILDQRDKINVVISTYSLVEKPQDNKFMRRLNPDVCVYDEGHLLKNQKTRKHQSLMKIPAKFRVLLTGTPLQNNLMELASLLNFILPSIFSEHQEDLDYVFKHKATTSATSHAALLNKERIARAKSMLTPFILQRKADVVLKDLPPKTNRVEYCDLHPSQAVVYNSLRDHALRRAELRLQGAKVPNDGENNPIMQARKAAIHPMLFRRHFTDDKLIKMLPILKRDEPTEFCQPSDKLMEEMKAFSDFYLHYWCTLYPSIAQFDVPSLTCMNSGKVQALVRLLEQYKANGDRVLVFSQFRLVHDILEEVLQTAHIPFSRIDGNTPVNDRQTIMDEFRNDESITAFLLSTGAGGTGINLEMANKVIIFDSSFNPHDDVQAEKRAHRLGQTRPVEVIRMVTRGTIEEQILALGEMKLTLDQKVTGLDDASASGERMVMEMLLRDQAETGVAEAKDVTGTEKAEVSSKQLRSAGTANEADLPPETRRGKARKTKLVTRSKHEDSEGLKLDDEMLL